MWACSPHEVRSPGMGPSLMVRVVDRPTPLNPPEQPSTEVHRPTLRLITIHRPVSTVLLLLPPARAFTTVCRAVSEWLESSSSVSLLQNHYEVQLTLSHLSSSSCLCRATKSFQFTLAWPSVDISNQTLRVSETGRVNSKMHSRVCTHLREPMGN